MARVVARSDNRKLGPGVGATYVSLATCPLTCRVIDECYAKFGHTGFVWRRVTRQAFATAIEEARDEARQLLALPRNMPVRLHVAGDMGITAGARLLARAAAHLQAFGYTHWWRRVSRQAWGRVSMLASCETAADIRLANARGYTAAIVVPTFPSAKRFPFGDTQVIPCPEQTGRSPSCAACRLCFDDRKLYQRGVSIGFAAHSSRARALKERLARLQGGPNGKAEAQAGDDPVADRPADRRRARALD